MQLTKNIKKLEKTLKKSGKKEQKCHCKDSDSDSEQGVGLSSTRKIVKFREPVENTSFTLPSPMKATPTTIASNSNDLSTASVSEASDVMMMSSDQKSKLLKKINFTPNKNPPEGKTTAIVAVMRGRPKHGPAQIRIPISVLKCQAYPQKFQIVHHSTYFEKASD